MTKNSRSKNGSSLAESAVAAIILVPIALAIIDLIVIVAANGINDTAAKSAARAAANQQDAVTAGQAATNAFSTFHTSNVITAFSGDSDWNPERVVVETKITVHLPVPFPGFSDLTFKAKDVEPVVAHN
ncbi:MAG: hypothetical protein U0103_17780 [Candidatus Obscuribacterales bacterium]|nr:hypothetical protein [Cyanobacteria bacterium SZAS LIN-5]